jgi:hypothetical protein
MAEVTNQNTRFLDQGILLDEFGDEFLVICPKCKGLAKVVPFSFELGKKVSKLFAPRRLMCLNCVFRDSWKGHKISFGGNIDWYFRLPLWLEISCCGETLWAYNLKHLGVIEQYVAAKLRERTKKGRNSFLSKLPNWLTAARNREEILKAIRKLLTKIT